jgi:diphthine synthase
MLFLIGLGLGDPKDITVRGLEILKTCDQVYLESYTSILIAENSKEELESMCGKTIELADREMIEQGVDKMLQQAQSGNVGLLIVGDPLGATTHTDILLRAKEMNVQTQVVHNASILIAIGSTGLQLYNFGETISIPMWTDTWKPDSFFDKICENKKRGLHTLCLLDIKVKEPNLESMMKGKIVYDPPRFMTIAQATDQLLQIIKTKSENPDDTQTGGSDCRLCSSDMCVGVARIGSPTQKIALSTLEDISAIDFGPPLHSIVIPGKLHPLELQFLETFGKS